MIFLFKSTLGYNWFNVFLGVFHSLHWLQNFRICILIIHWKYHYIKTTPFFSTILDVSKNNNGYNYLFTCYENCTSPLSIGFGVVFCLYCVIVSLVCDCYLIFVGGGWRRGLSYWFDLGPSHRWSWVQHSLQGDHDMHNQSFSFVKWYMVFQQIDQAYAKKHMPLHWHLNTCAKVAKVADVLTLGRRREVGGRRSLGPERHLLK